VPEFGQRPNLRTKKIQVSALIDQIQRKGDDRRIGVE
jgi:hypothetical protein